MKIFTVLGLWVGCAVVVAGSLCGAESGLAQGVANAQAVPAQTAEPVILDTDIGDDIDDAYALALALQSPEVHLLGITTAFGDTDLRAKLVGRYLGSLCRFDFNVIPGVPTPQANVFTQSAYARGAANQSCGKVTIRTSTMADEARLEKENKQETAKWEADQARTRAGFAHIVQQREAHDAAGFLLEQVRDHPGQITLIAIGPLFNVEEAIKRDPATFRKLKRVVIMGGSIDRGYDGRSGERRPPDAEWNINRDPAGLRALLNSGVPVFMMPLDSTQIHLETKEREAIFAHGSPLTDQLTLLYHQWKAGTDGHPDAPTLFDPVAVTYAIRPDLCPAVPMRIEVDDKGYTRRVDGSPNVQVCLKSDETGFLNLLLTRLVGTPAQ